MQDICCPPQHKSLYWALCSLRIKPSCLPEDKTKTLLSFTLWMFTFSPSSLFFLPFMPCNHHRQLIKGISELLIYCDHEESFSFPPVPQDHPPHKPQDFKEMGFIWAVHLVAGYLSFIHLTVGAGSPTALQGRTMSFIQGVVTVPLNVRILAGAGGREQEALKWGVCSNSPWKGSRDTHN